MLPHLRVGCMLPKFILLYKDPQLQQRWISEVCALTNFSQDVVRKCVQEKKQRWKCYRE